MSNATQSPTTTRRIAYTVAEAMEMEKALRVLKPQSVTFKLDGPWIIKGTSERVDTDAAEVGHVPHGDRAENWLPAEVDGRIEQVAPTRERVYGGDRYGRVIVQIEW